MTIGSLIRWLMPVLVAAMFACHRTEIARQRCGTNSPSADKVRRMQDKIEQFKSTKEDFEPTTPQRIQVFFHVITGGPNKEDGNVTRDQIDKQMTVLNQAFTTTHFQFDLAKVDYELNPKWFAMAQGKDEEMAARAKLNVNHKDALNVYSANTSCYGWSVAYEKIESDPYQGAVILFSTLPDGAFTHYNQGHTLVHEAGHWLGLFHTYYGGCSDLGDYVPDTAPEGTQTPGCPADGKDTCPGDGPDPIDNFMDDSSDDCTNKFTFDQSVRMDQVFACFRGP